MKKILCALMLVCMAVPCAWADVAIDGTNFPDEVFRAYVRENFDTDSDGVLSGYEIAGVNSIDVHDRGITSLAGVKVFTSLENLRCSANSIDVLDVSGCADLKILWCWGSGISSLNVNGCASLEDIDCGRNSLSSLSVRSCSALKRLHCYGNKLTALDVGGNTSLRYLSCENNMISELDLSSNADLRTLNCKNNLLKTLDLSRNANLTDAVSLSQDISGLAVHSRDDGTYYTDLRNDYGLSPSSLANIPVSGVFALNVPGKNILTGYSAYSGVASFSEEPEVLHYYYKTGSKHSMSVTFNALPRIKATELGRAYAGVSYEFDLEAQGRAALRWRVAEGSELPSGLRLGLTTGKISGIPASEGKYTFTLSVSNEAGSTSKTFSLEVLPPSSAPGRPTITTAQGDILPGYVSYKYTFQFSASGNVSRWSMVSGDIPGISLSSGGRLSGIPEREGIFPFTVRASDTSSGTDDKSFTFSVHPSSQGGLIPSITTTHIPQATEKEAYSTVLHASGAGTITWSLVSGDVPEGFTLSGNGTLSGTPPEAGYFRFTVRAENEYGHDDGTLWLTVNLRHEGGSSSGGGGGCESLGGIMVLAGLCVMHGLRIRRRK